MFTLGSFITSSQGYDCAEYVFRLETDYLVARNEKVCTSTYVLKKALESLARNYNLSMRLPSYTCLLQTVAMDYSTGKTYTFEKRLR